MYKHFQVLYSDAAVNEETVVLSLCRALWRSPFNMELRVIALFGSRPS